jgi:hypothetical protein
LAEPNRLLRGPGGRSKPRLDPGRLEELDPAESLKKIEQLGRSCQGVEERCPRLRGALPRLPR